MVGLTVIVDRFIWKGNLKSAGDWKYFLWMYWHNKKYESWIRKGGDKLAAKISQGRGMTRNKSNTGYTEKAWASYKKSWVLWGGSCDNGLETVIKKHYRPLLVICCCITNELKT